MNHNIKTMSDNSSQLTEGISIDEAVQQKNGVWERNDTVLTQYIGMASVAEAHEKYLADQSVYAYEMDFFSTYYAFYVRKRQLEAIAQEQMDAIIAEKHKLYNPNITPALNEAYKILSDNDLNRRGSRPFHVMASELYRIEQGISQRNGNGTTSNGQKRNIGYIQQ